MGGGQIGVFEIAKRLSLENDVTVIYPSSSEKLKKLVSEYSCDQDREEIFNRATWPFRIIELPYQMGTFDKLFSSDWWRANSDLWQTIRKNRFDIIIVFSPIYFSIGIILSNLFLNTKTLLFFIGRETRDITTNIFRKLLANVLIKSSMDVVFISNWLKKELENTFGAIPGYVIAFGANAQDNKGHLDRGIWKTLDVQKDSKVVLCVQRIVPMKRVDIVVEAVHLLILKGWNIILVIVGPNQNWLQDWCRERNYLGFIRFTGYATEIQKYQYLRNADIFVFHSTFETFGVSLVEAMSAGLPIVVADETASSELIEEKINGIHAKPLDADDIAQKIELLLLDNDLGAELGRNARLDFEKHYNWDSIVQELLSLISSK
jgi:glycosyltransferase involved in cell wall biosynthesis